MCQTKIDKWAWDKQKLMLIAVCRSTHPTLVADCVWSVHFFLLPFHSFTFLVLIFFFGSKKQMVLRGTLLISNNGKYLFRSSGAYTSHRWRYSQINERARARAYSLVRIIHFLSFFVCFEKRKTFDAQNNERENDTCRTQRNLENVF